MYDKCCNFYFVLFNCNSYPSLEAWTHSEQLAMMYAKQWEKLEPVIYEYKTESDVITSKDVQDFISDITNGGFTFNDYDELYAINVPRFGYSDHERPMIVKDNQFTEIHDGFNALESDIGGIMVSVLETLIFISKYIKVDNFGAIMKIIYDIYIKRFIVATRLDMSELNDKDRVKLRLPTQDESEFLSQDEAYCEYMLLRIVLITQNLTGLEDYTII